MLNKRAAILLLICCTSLWMTTVAQEEEEECEDLAKCGSMKAYCDHPSYQDYVRSVCKKSCKRCRKDLDPNGLCSKNYGGCSQNCEVIDKTIKKCVCFPGYKLNKDNVTCEDIDECETVTCPFGQHCTNTLGGFVCDFTRCDSSQNEIPYMGRSECCVKEPKDAECGITGTDTQRILGGTDSFLGQWPWQVLIIIDNTVICGGSLISKEWVVTAGHCFRGYNKRKRYEILFGALVFNDRGGREVQHRRMKKHVLYPDWNEKKFEINDIALIQLNRPVQYTPYVKPVCLPNGEKPNVGATCFAAGWGLREEDATKPAPTLQHVDLPIVDDAKCENNYKDEDIKVNGTIMTCAGYDEGGKDACRGDSGGPLVCQRCDSCGWYLSGVVSFGSGCGRAGLYGVYADVTYYEDWISEVTGIYVSKEKSCSGPYFSQWSKFDKCSKSCGRGGTRTRTRQCLHKGKPSTDCEGKLTQQQECPFTKCPELSDWGEWSPCSESCGRGVSIQVKECLNGEMGDDGCPVKDTSRERTCNTQTCPRWSNWEDWSTCSRSCGSGESKRKRTCINGKRGDDGCKGNIEETRTCNTDQCPGWSNWGDWEKCSKTCAGGTQISKRKCIGQGKCSPGSNTKTRDCNQQACPVFGNWDDWSECDASCGTGAKSRRRQCENGKVGDAGCEKGKEVEVEECNIQRCPEFTQWSKWSKCTVTCGGGKQESSRRCDRGTIGQDGCTGSAKRMRDCATDECKGKFEDWSDWSTCSKKCGEGTQTRERECVGGVCDGEAEETQKCEIKKCPEYSDWTKWEDCTVSCGGGEQSRSRTCQHTNNTADCKGDSEETRKCNQQKCPGTWTQWTRWSKCDVTCGEGTVERSRKCEGGAVGDEGCDDGPEREAKRCTTVECPSRWGEWGDWSTCSKPCDRGLQTRNRRCEGGKPGTGGCLPASGDTEEQACNEIICGTCNDYPGNYCRTTFTSQRICDGNTRLAQTYCPVTCNLCPGLHEHWNSWEPCSSSCGDGIRRRTRDCNVSRGCEGPNSETGECRGNCRGFSAWTRWSQCTASCDGGTRSRSRSCSFNKCEPDEFGSTDLNQEEECNIQTCPGEWGDWEKWGPCSETCGDDGVVTRQRKCKGAQSGDPGCEGEDKEEKSCTQNPACPGKWTDWSDWGDCSASCGKGERTKTRRCENGIPGNAGCRGSNTMREECDAGICLARWGEWTKWGECDDTCVRSRTRICNGGKAGSRGCVGNEAQTEDCDPSLCGKDDPCENNFDSLPDCSYPDYACLRSDIKAACAKTCCQKLKTLECEDDEVWHDTCKLYYDRGFCSQDAFYLLYCRKSCRLC